MTAGTFKQKITTTTNSEAQLIEQMGFPALFRALMSQTDPQKNVILSNGIGYHSESESQGFYCSCPSFARSLYKLVLNIAFGSSKLLLVFQQSQGHLSRQNC